MEHSLSEELTGTILITGASGYIGSMLVKKILCGCNAENTHIRLVLPVRNQKKMEDILRDLDDSGQAKITLYETSLEEMDENLITEEIDYIIHCASVTSSKEMIEKPVETADGIVFGTYNVLRLARKKKVKSMVYLSSMEVYGLVDEGAEKVTEEMSGNVDIFKVRSCYPLGKRMAEHYCYLFYKEYKVPVKIARLAQAFGAGVRADDNRVFMQFADAIKHKRDIILHTDGSSMGNYCEIEDALSGILLLLARGACGEAYNVVNEENTMTILEMAQLAASQSSEESIRVVVQNGDSDALGYAPKTGLRLSGKKLMDLGWKPRKDMVQMYRDLLDGMR